MRKFFTLFLLLLAGVAMAQVERTVVYDFTNPTELDPSLGPIERENGSQIPLTDSCFVNEDAKILFTKTEVSDGARLDLDREENLHFVRMYSSSSATINVGQNTLKKVEFRATLSGLVLDSKNGEFRNNLVGEYPGIWTYDPAVPTGEIKFTSRSPIPALVYEIRVTYLVKPDVLMAVNNPFPTNKEINSLSSFALDFGKDVKVAAGKKATITSSKLATPIELSLAVSEKNSQSIICSLPEELLMPGTYTVTIPEGTVYSKDEVYYNPQQTFTFKLVEAVNTFAVLKTIPATETVLDELPSGFKVIFKNLIGGMPAELKNLSVYRVEDEESTVATRATFAMDTENDSALVVNFTRGISITEPGKYVLTIPEKAVYNLLYLEDADDYGVSDGARYNPETTLTFFVKTEVTGKCPCGCGCDDTCECDGTDCGCGCNKLPESLENLVALQAQADSLCNISGVGYPALESAAKKALAAAATMALPAADDLEAIAAAEENIKNLMAAYYESAEIALPENGKVYTISNVAKDGKVIYLSYNKGAIGLTADAEQAAPFVALTQEDGTIAFKTIDGKFLHALVNNDQYKGTSAANVTAELGAVNMLKLDKLAVEGVSAEESFGLVTLYGYIGELMGESYSAYSMIDVENEAIVVVPEKVIFDAQYSSAFRLEEYVAPIDPFFSQYELSVQPGLVDLLTSIVLTFPELEGQNVEYNPKNPVTFVRGIGAYNVPVNVAKVKGTTNSFILTFGEYEYSGGYKLTIPEGAFVCGERVNKAIVEAYTLSQSFDFAYDYFDAASFITLVNDQVKAECAAFEFNDVIFYDNRWNSLITVTDEYRTNSQVVEYSSENAWVENEEMPDSLQQVIKEAALAELTKIALTTVEQAYVGKGEITKELEPEIVVKYNRNEAPMTCTYYVKCSIPVELTPNDARSFAVNTQSTVAVRDHNYKNVVKAVGTLEPVKLYFKLDGNSEFVSQKPCDFIEGVVKVCSGARFIPSKTITETMLDPDPKYGTVFEFQFEKATFGDANYGEYLKDPSSDKKNKCHVNGEGYSVTLRAYPDSYGDGLNPVFDEVENQKQGIYDLSGRRVTKMNKAGIYIVNGKKVVLK